MPRGTQVLATLCSVSDTGLSPSLECLPRTFLLLTYRSILQALQPHMIETIWFRLIPFRSPLLRESRLISLPAGTEMFHFPALAPTTLFYSGSGDGLFPSGFPIQKSPDHRILGSFPRLIAADHVFHRLLVPRHPPVALLILVFFKTFRYSTVNTCAISSLLPFLPYSIFNEHPKLLRYVFRLNLICSHIKRCDNYQIQTT